MHGTQRREIRPTGGIVLAAHNDRKSKTKRRRNLLQTKLEIIKKLDDLPEAQLEALRQRLSLGSAGSPAQKNQNKRNGDGEATNKEEQTTLEALNKEEEYAATEVGEYGLINDMMYEEVNNSAVLNRILGLSEQPLTTIDNINLEEI